MKSAYYLLYLPIFFTLAAGGTNLTPSALGQGLMAGEATSTSIILQARLTRGMDRVDGDLPGQEGVGQFELDTRPDFSAALSSGRLRAEAGSDYILKYRFDGLEPGKRYYYRLRHGAGTQPTEVSETATFRTLPGENSVEAVSFVAVTGMNYYHFHYGKYDRSRAYAGPDKDLGYPALAAISAIGPEYFVGTGDTVYFDHPARENFERAISEGKDPHPGMFDGEAVTDEAGMRRKYHLQFSQPRFRDLFSQLATYWEKDDHDYRANDADPYMDYPISHELGVKNFREQLPVTDPADPGAPTYRTHRMSKDLQIWLLEGRDHRSPNEMDDGPGKSLWGSEQLEWLKRTLLASDATFKLIVSPTPLVGPDDAYKSDNHVNHRGFRHEGDAFIEWLQANRFPEKNLYLVCGDRHWQYHARHPAGVEEFSTGALVDNNSRAGRLAGDPASSDPEGLIRQYYIQGRPEQASGGFLHVNVSRRDGMPTASFSFHDENGLLLYRNEKTVRQSLK